MNINCFISRELFNIKNEIYSYCYHCYPNNHSEVFAASIGEALKEGVEPVHLRKFLYRYIYNQGVPPKLGFVYLVHSTDYTWKDVNNLLQTSFKRGQIKWEDIFGDRQ